ncbi:MAG: hypothetical protein IKX40_11005 [Thermoguttaceae bacterium]|nr:hypothetical protein [Thermoguttaceae bacterium]
MESKFKHIGSLLFLCFLFFLFIPIFINIDGRWYSIESAVDIAKAIAGYIVGATLLSTIILVVMLHRVRSAILDTDKSIKDADTSVQNAGAHLEKLNERIKTLARMVDDIKDIEQKISERPPVVIQKKESNQ